MNDKRNPVIYVCPMHAGVRQQQPGHCPTCGMNLMAENARFKFLRHILGSPMHIAIMAGIMIVVMTAAMMMVR